MNRSASADRLESRLNRLRGEPAYQGYLDAREHVLALLNVGSEDSSAYWREELDNFEYLLDASPLVIERLRHHCFHVTGVRVYEYRSGQDRLRSQLVARLRALKALDSRGLLVPEPPDLGGFGFEIDGALVNLDTIKYYESLVALERGAVLDTLRDKRSIICEIGGGWGGMASQLKTVMPNCTYVIVDLPELFLLSATYLSAVFPDARLAYWGEDIDWSTVDFLFVPNTAVEELRPPHVDMVLNTVSFQEMTTHQVETYVDHFASLGTPIIYSLNRDRSVYNHELSSVREIIQRSYDLREVQMLDMPYNRLGVSAPLKERLARRLGRRENEYRHVVGSLRG
jgi:hypothetical protein